MKKIMISIIILMIILTACFFLLNKKDNDTQTIRILVSDGVSSAQLHVMEELHLVEKYAPDTKVEFQVFYSGSAINEAFIANQGDIASLGIANFLTGLDKGISYKVAAAVSHTRFGLQTNNPNIKSLKDIGPDDKIAVSSLTGIHGTLLKMACEKELGDPDALKDNIVVMDASDAELALINKSSGISLHMAEIANILRENRAGCPTILDNVDILGVRCTNMVTVASTDFAENHPDLYNAYVSALEEATTLINNRDEQALEIISTTQNISKEEIIEYLDSDSLIFSTTKYNILPITDFLYKIGQISIKIESLQDISFPNVTETK